MVAKMIVLLLSCKNEPESSPSKEKQVELLAHSEAWKAVGLSGEGPQIVLNTQSPPEVVVLNVENPAVPAVRWEYQVPPGRVMAVRLLDPWVYVVYESKDGGDGGIQIHNLSGGEPTWIGTPLKAPHSIQLADNQLYVSGDGGVRSFDVSDPTNPVLLHTWNSGIGEFSPDELLVAGDLLYVSAQRGLVVLSRSDLSMAGYVLYNKGTLHNLAKMEDVLYTSDESVDGQLLPWDLSADPTHPTPLSSIAITHHANIYGLATTDQRLWGAWYEEGIRSWDLTDPAHPQEDFGLDTCACEVTDPPSGASALWSDGQQVVVSDTMSGLYFFR